MLTVATFYRFTDLSDHEVWRDQLKEQCENNDVLGIIILANEGLNSTISGPEKGINAVLGFIRSDQRFKDLPHRECKAQAPPFNRLRIIIRPEIVTLGDKSVNPNEEAGEYIDPKEWNELIKDPDILLIDTRNDYEVQIGTFKNAINPDTQTFGQWDKYVNENLNPEKHKKVAMFCTGGIRCEKASAHMLKNGFEKVYHLQGGILNYLEKIKPEESLWEGECFVFDHRVSVLHGLEEGTCEICFGCRWPLKAEGLKSDKYEPGICCPRCADGLSQKRRASLTERHRQVMLAQANNREHIGQYFGSTQVME